MVSKCANPACSERFLYLHQGKLFQLTPPPEVEAAEWDSPTALSERFWLCDQCCKKMTLVRRGAETKLVPLPAEPVAQPSAIPPKVDARQKPRRRTTTTELQQR
jgi:hypothetical protein